MSSSNLITQNRLLWDFCFNDDTRDGERGEVGTVIELRVELVKFFNLKSLKHLEFKTLLCTNHLLSRAHLSTAPHLKLHSQSQVTLSDNLSTPSPISESLLLDSIKSSQWHFIKQVAPSLTPSVICPILTHLSQNPQLVLQLLSHLHSNSLDFKTHCLAIAIISRLSSPKPAIEYLRKLITHGIATNRVIFDELTLLHCKFNLKSSIVFDYLVMAYCELKKASEALECFYMMKEKGVSPKTETCNMMLSLLLKLNRTDMAWVLYAEMFRLKIKSSVRTYNIMINVLCKEGKLIKAKEFIGYMETLGVKPDTVTYNTVIHAYCMRGKVDVAQGIFKDMKDKGLEPDSYTYNAFITAVCKAGRLEEASELLKNMLVPDAVTYNALIDGYCAKGDLDKAIAYRDEMISRDVGMWKKLSAVMMK
ncbi:hypothetical protein K1719_004876 [Acacia pycnantha]|nr:hypothetical protein K1719_004876 [Acacia pycnantha]